MMYLNIQKLTFYHEVGKRTPMFIRFSTVAGELGSADTVRDPRGFSVKFYTEEGNYDHRRKQYTCILYS